MQARESQWAAERLAFLEKERVSKQMIFNLQQDNYRLRKSRIVSCDDYLHCGYTQSLF